MAWCAMQSDRGKRLDDLTLEEMRKYSGLVGKDVLSVIAVTDKLRGQSAGQFGGTSTKQAAAPEQLRDRFGLSINEQERFNVTSARKDRNCFQGP